MRDNTNSLETKNHQSDDRAREDERKKEKKTMKTGKSSTEYRQTLHTRLMHAHARTPHDD